MKRDQSILCISSKAQPALVGIRFTIIQTLYKYKLASNKSLVIRDQARFYQLSYIRSYAIVGSAEKVGVFFLGLLQYDICQGLLKCRGQTVRSESK